MKLTETKLRRIIREELSKINERSPLDKYDPENIEVYAAPNPSAGRYGGPEWIDLFVTKDTGEFVEALGPPGQPIEDPGWDDYGEMLARDARKGKFDKAPYDTKQIIDRLKY